MKRFFVIIIFILFTSNIHSQIDYWNESKAEKDARMEWWRDAKFGMFLHWGLYAIPAGEWNGETNHAEWIRTTAQIPLETYNKFLEEFNPIDFDAEKWVLTAKNAGMKYIVITSKHHDGFCLFDSKYTDYDVMSTPFKRDILKELSDAAVKYDIKLGFYYSIMDWHHEDYLPRRGWEKDRSTEGANFDNYVIYMKNQLKELVTNYEINQIWFDGEWEKTWTHERGVDLYNYVRSLKPSILVNNRVDVGRSGMAGMTKEGFVGDFGTPEQEVPEEGFPGVDWESCITMNGHWGYNKNDHNWKYSNEVIKMLVNITSKGGNLLLNVGPKSNGEFPKASSEILENVGKWLEKNSEVIFDTEISKLTNIDFGECSQKSIGENTKLYFTVTDSKETPELVISGILNKPIKSYLLSDKNKQPLQVKNHEDKITITLPNEIVDRFNPVVVLEIEGKPDITSPPSIISENNIFITEQTIRLETDREGAQIRYTLDGSEPNKNSKIYTSPITIKESSTVTARCFRDDKPVSTSISNSYKKVVGEPSINLDKLQPGLKCDYYEGEWEKLPEFEGLQSAKSSIVKIIDTSLKSRDEQYGMVFSGFIKVPEDAVYNFYIESDDGSKLFINEKLLVDNDGLHSLERKSENIALKSGFHKIRVTYFQNSGGDDLKVLYRFAKNKITEIPQDILFHK